MQIKTDIVRRKIYETFKLMGQFDGNFVYIRTELRLISVHPHKLLLHECLSAKSMPIPYQSERNEFGNKKKELTLVRSMTTIQKSL